MFTLKLLRLSISCAKYYLLKTEQQQQKIKCDFIALMKCNTKKKYINETSCFVIRIQNMFYNKIA